MTVRTRFAPSPTGYLHLGGLRTALYTYLFARKNKGTFILRVEDTDREREVAGAVEKIYEAMRLSGLNYDEGPDVGGDYGPYIQSERKDMYLPYARRLVESGHAYYCFCTKEQLESDREKAESEGKTYKYGKRCLHLPKDEIERRIAAGESYVIRQNVPETGKAGFTDALYGRVEVDCSTLDDNVLIKADGLPTYNFANVVDDHTMGITHVMRGTEYLSSAPKYDLMYAAFGWQPPVYVHLPPVMIEDFRRDKMTKELIPDENGEPVTIVRKLSKRYGDPTFEDLLDAGYLRDAIINYIALLGWSPGGEREFFTLSELESEFDLNGIGKAPSLFDMRKLTWFNAEYTRRLSPEEYVKHALPWLEKALDTKKFDINRLCELTQSRTEVFSQLPEMVGFLNEMPEFDAELYTHKKMKTNPEIALDALKKIKPVLENVSEWTEQNLHDSVMRAIETFAMKNGQMLWPLRIAVSGKANTPGGAFEIMYLLGKDETLARLSASVERLSV